MTNKSTLRIAIPEVSTRNWKFIKDLPFTPEEIVTICHRYCDAQDHAKNYRVKAATNAKADKAELARLKALFEANKVEVEG